jgi:hypothetical protein
VKAVSSSPGLASAASFWAATANTWVLSTRRSRRTHQRQPFHTRRPLAQRNNSRAQPRWSAPCSGSQPPAPGRMAMPCRTSPPQVGGAGGEEPNRPTPREHPLDPQPTRCGSNTLKPRSLHAPPHLATPHRHRALCLDKALELVRVLGQRISDVRGSSCSSTEASPAFSASAPRSTCEPMPTQPLQYGATWITTFRCWARR